MRSAVPTMAGARARSRASARVVHIPVPRSMKSASMVVAAWTN
jgi:hypothetical protein